MTVKWKCVPTLKVKAFVADCPTESKDGDINPSFSMCTYVLLLTFHELYKIDIHILHHYYTYTSYKITKKQFVFILNVTSVIFAKHTHILSSRNAVFLFSFQLMMLNNVRET